MRNLPIFGHFLGALQKTGPLGYHETNMAELAADSGTANLLLADRGPFIQIFASETFLNLSYLEEAGGVRLTRTLNL